jgi:hypothetical protein
MSRINVAVALRDDAREWIFEIAAACRALGLKHASTLRNVGVLTGSVEVEDLPKLRAIPGVLAVEPKRGSRMNGTPPGHGRALQRESGIRRGCVQIEGKSLRCRSATPVRFKPQDVAAGGQSGGVGIAVDVPVCARNETGYGAQDLGKGMAVVDERHAVARGARAGLRRHAKLDHSRRR